MKKGFLSYKRSSVGYYRFGHGPRLAICFHGYGEDALMYAFMEKYAADYTFYSMDLPFHGNTVWNEGLNFTHTDLQQIIHDILLENNIALNADTTAGITKLSLIGFSLGGRVALSLYQAWPDSIEKIVLLAPDGLTVNFWYWLATRTWPGNKLFAFTMKHPGWFMGFLKLLSKTGMVNASVIKFVNYYIGNTEARLKLYQRWTTLRRLKPSLKRIKACITRLHTPVRLIYGKFDRIILPVRGKAFVKGIENFAELRVIDSGHQVLNEKHAVEIVESLRV
jgi:pimeloyl-ACP methyl ester carboxylesterase